MGEEEQVEKFLSVITKSIDKGYGEATRSLIDDKLAAFREAKLGKAEAE